MLVKLPSGEYINPEFVSRVIASPGRAMAFCFGAPLYEESPQVQVRYIEHGAGTAWITALKCETYEEAQTKVDEIAELINRKAAVNE